MSFVKNKNDLFSMILIGVLAIGAGYSVTMNYFSTQGQPIQFSQLSDADIDMILAVKNEMYRAKMRAN